MNIIELMQTHRVALGTDNIFVALQKQSDKQQQARPRNISAYDIYIRNLLFDEVLKLSDFVVAPFFLVHDTYHHIIARNMRHMDSTILFRVVEVPRKNGIVEIIDVEHPNWFQPALGGIRIYVPK